MLALRRRPGRGVPAHEVRIVLISVETGLGMERFWKYQVRYRIARWLMHLGLSIMPPGRAKTEVLALLGAWGRHVMDTVSNGNSDGHDR